MCDAEVEDEQHAADMGMPLYIEMKVYLPKMYQNSPKRQINISIQKTITEWLTKNLPTTSTSMIQHNADDHDEEPGPNCSSNPTWVWQGKLRSTSPNSHLGNGQSNSQGSSLSR